MENSEQHIKDLPEVIAAAVWEKLRRLAAAVTQYDAFVFGDPPEASARQQPQSATTTGAGDADRIAEDFTLSFLGQAVNPDNYRLLSAIANAESVSPAALTDQTGMPELAVQERLSTLLQSGFIDKNYESGHYSATEAASGLIDLIEASRALLSAKIASELPDKAGR